MERTKSPSALYLLFVEGFCLLFIAVAVIACGFVLNYHEDFDYDQVDSEHDYTQYWVGFVLFITAFLAIGAGTAQRSRWTVVSAMFLFLVSILVCLFALVVEGNDWINHKNDVRRMEFWESEDYQCDSPDTTSCVCLKAGADIKRISGLLNCDALERLDHLYGALVCCILAAIFLALTSIIVVMIFIPIRPFTVPVPKKRIKRITVIEDKPEPPVVVYKPPPKRIERKPEVEEIVVREVRERRPPPRIVVQPEPEPEVEEIVVRERRPEARTIVYEPRQERQEVVRGVARKRTIIYDQPRFEGPVRGSRELVPIEAPPKRDSKKDQVYEVGRFVPKIHPTPDDPPMEGMENGFIVNPNFKKPEILPEPEELDEPEPVHYGTQEVEPPVRHVNAQQPVVRYVRGREAPEQVRHIRQAPRVVHERYPRVVEERALVPVRSSRPKGHVVVQSSHPRPSYIIRRPGQRSLIAVRRPRSNSDEGAGLVRVRRTHRQHQRRHVYATQPARAVTTRPKPTTVPWQRFRSNSDEGPRLYRENMPQERQARIYTDKEIQAAGGNVPQGPVEGAKPRVFNGGNIGTASLEHRPPSAHINPARNEHYDPALEVNLPSADQEQWSRRPGTPY